MKLTEIMTNQTSRETQCDRSGRRRLAAWGLLLAVSWLLVLPWLARREAMAEKLRWLESRGIDPSAMYYTELEAMNPILDRLNRQRRLQPGADKEINAGARAADSKGGEDDPAETGL